MRQFLSVLLSLLLVVTLLPPLQAAANEGVPFDEFGIRNAVDETYTELLAVENWVTFPTKLEVSLNKEWVINFSGIATAGKIEAISIERNGQLIPLKVNFDNSKIAKVKPNNNLLGGRNYILKILLANGKKYKMDFTTAKRIVDIETNDSYLQAKELYIDEIIQGGLSATDKTDFYKIKVAADGLVDITFKGLDTNKLSLYVYDQEGTDGDLLAYKVDQATARLVQELKAGTYYIQVTGNGKYEATTSVTPSFIDVTKALQVAQNAVYALPAPMDVKASHTEAIRAASILVARTKSLGADVESLEAIIAQLQKVILPLEIASIRVLNTTTLEVTFNKAVDTSVALFKVDASPVKKVAFNANKKVAKVELTSKIAAGDYTLSIEGVAEGKLTKTIKADDEKVASITILSDVATLIAGNQVSVGYKVENQYGEDMTKSANLATTVSIAGLAVAEKGVVKIPSAGANEGDLITLTLTNTATGITAERIVTVSMKAAVFDIAIKELRCVSGNKLMETTDFTTDTFYLVVEAKDQHGNIIEDEDILNIPNAIRLVQTDVSIIQFESEFEEINGQTVLKLKGTPKFGESTVTLTARDNKASYLVKVAEGQRVDEVTLGEPSTKIAGEDLFIPITVFDKDRKQIIDQKVIDSPVGGVKFTASIPDTIVLDPITNNFSGIKFDKSHVVAGNLTIKAEYGAKKSVTKTIIVQPKAIPTTWVEKAGSTIIKDINMKVNKAAQSIGLDNIQIFDQYGKIMDNPFANGNQGYSLVVTDANPSGGAISVVGNTVTPIAVGTEKVFIKIKDSNNKDVSGNEKEITFTVTDGTNYISYEVEPIGIVYDEVAAGRTNNDIYNKAVKVYGINPDKTKEPLKHGAIADGGDFIVSAVNKTLNKDLEDGILHFDTEISGYIYDGVNEINPEVTVTINSTGEKHTQKITMSKETPFVKELQIKKKGTNVPIQTISYDAKTNLEFDFAKLLSIADIVAKDQYGVSVLATNSNELKFPDGTPIQSKLKFKDASAGFKTSANGETMTELPANSSFNAIVYVDGVEANPIKVNVTNGYTPATNEAQLDVDNKAAKITRNELEKSPLVTNDNVLTKAKQLVGTGYTVTIESSSNLGAIAHNGIVTQPDLTGTLVTVLFKVSKNGFFQEVTVDLFVNRAPSVDKTKLIATINGVQSVGVSVNGSEIDPSKKWTTQNEKNALDTVVNAAKVVNNKTDATQWEVTLANSALVEAVVAYEKVWKDGIFTISTNNATKNDIATLGLVGISATSSDNTIAIVEITFDDKIAITSETAGAAGTVIITVKDASGNEAKISATVKTDGTIEGITITKFDAVAAATAAVVAYEALGGDLSTEILINAAKADASNLKTAATNAIVNVTDTPTRDALTARVDNRSLLITTAATISSVTVTNVFLSGAPSSSVQVTALVKNDKGVILTTGVTYVWSVVSATDATTTINTATNGDLLVNNTTLVSPTITKATEADVGDTYIIQVIATKDAVSITGTATVTIN